jgi:hypothetical protein
MKMTPREATVFQLNATNFDNTMTIRRFQARCFRIQYDLSHEAAVI